MKTENSDKFLEAVLKNIYTFQVKDRDIKVVFSDSPKAQTIENALVKIATRRIG